MHQNPMQMKEKQTSKRSQYMTVLNNHTVSTAILLYCVLHTNMIITRALLIPTDRWDAESSWNWSLWAWAGHTVCRWKTSSVCVSFMCTHQTDKSAFIQAVWRCVSLKPRGAWTRRQEENRKQGCGDAIRQRKEKKKKGGAVDLTQPR